MAHSSFVLKATLIATLLCTMSGLFVVAHAQGHFDFDLSYSLPAGDLADGFDGAIGVAGRYVHPVSPFVGFGLQVGYQKFTLDKDLESSFSNRGYAVSGGDLSITSFELISEVRTGAADLASFAAFAGIGLFSVSLSELALTPENGPTQRYSFFSQTRLGGSIGGSILVPVNFVRVGLTTQYRMYVVDDIRRDIQISGDTRRFFSAALTISLWL